MLGNHRPGNHNTLLNLPLLLAVGVLIVCLLIVAIMCLVEIKYIVADILLFLTNAPKR